MTDPYDDKSSARDEIQRSADTWNGVSNGVQTGMGIVFLVIGVGGLIAAAIFQERVALMVGIVAILFGLTRILLPWLRSRR